MIDLDQKSLELVKKIMSKHLPGVTVKVFGSRVTGKAKRYSDLDLVIKGEEAIPMEMLNAIKFDFSDSDLPILVDIVDWHAITPEFRQAIVSVWQDL